MSGKNDNFLPIKRAIKPTSNAAIIVPSLTPTSFPINTKDNTAAMTVIETSKATFVTPNSVFQVDTIALTKDSPGSITTFAKTSIYTPKPSIKHPINRYTICIMYIVGLTNPNKIMVKSIKYPNAIDTGICRTCSNLKFFLKIINCRRINKILKIIVNCPNVSGKCKLKT